MTRVIRILEALATSPAPVGLTQLSRMLETPKSSLAALLRGLASEDILVVSDGAYCLGPGAFGLGSALLEARRRLQSSELLRDGMRRLAQASGETALLAVRDDGADTMTYVDVVESRNAVRFAVSIGDRRPLYCTAGGRALLAAQPERDWRRYLGRLKPARLTARTQIDKRQLAAAIANAGKDGFAQTVDQASDGVAGTAAVIRDATGSVVGALIVAAPTSRLRDRGVRLARLVVQEARAISRNLGHR